MLIRAPYPDGGAMRPYNLGDAPTPPYVWIDMQDASSVAYDSGTSRITSVGNKGSGGGSFVPASTGTAPLYNASSFNSALPAAVFNADDPDMLVMAGTPMNQPATGVYVWQEGASVRAYEVFVDHTNAAGNRQQLFTTYDGSTNPIYMVRGPVDGNETNVNLMTSAQAANKINILIVEFNGTSSRIYYNGLETSGFDLGSVVSNTGFTLGGKLGDSPTYFGGKAGEFAVLPAIFSGDAWDRITQGTMWHWQQQANIATGATYKTAAPMVPA